MCKSVLFSSIFGVLLFSNYTFAQALYTVRDEVTKYVIKDAKLIEQGTILHAGTKFENGKKDKQYYFFESETDLFAIHEKDLTAELSKVAWKDLGIQISLLGVDVQNDEFAFGNEIKSTELKEVEFWDSFSGHLIDRIRVLVNSNVKRRITSKIHVYMKLSYRQENGIPIELAELLLTEVAKEISHGTQQFDIIRNLQFELKEKMKFYNWYLEKQNGPMPNFSIIFTGLVTSPDILEFNLENNVDRKVFELSAH